MIQGPTPAANKLAMSKALGAAFLNHQVEQLEKSVGGGNRAGTEGNWRDRRFRPGQERQGNTGRRPQGGAGAGPRAGARPKSGAADRTEGGGVVVGGDRGRKDDGLEKDADVVVVDASVLVHALPQVKKWCRDGRKEIVVESWHIDLAERRDALLQIFMQDKAPYKMSTRLNGDVMAMKPREFAAVMERGFSGAKSVKDCLLDADRPRPPGPDLSKYK